MDFTTLHNKNTGSQSIIQEDISDLLTLTFIVPDDFKYNLFRVPADYVARMDLISLDHYGVDDYVDVLCKLNGISNPFEINEGDIIVLPSPGDINRFFYSGDDIESIPLKQKDKDAPRAKAKNEKRKANEAVIGDSRYRIDKDRQVVIY